MLKVIIADDEKRICKLINILVPWEELGLQVVGFAKNGIEAEEEVKRKQPDILITDIRMPGMDGLQLIQRVKEEQKDLEIIIISGYANFSYAQNAIKYGVGNYLLKPVNQTELIQTLQKLYKKIMERKGIEEDLKRLESFGVNARNRLEFIEKIASEEEIKENLDELNKNYGLNLKPGVIKGFCIKMDYDSEKVNQESIKVISEKFLDLLECSLKPYCFELLTLMGEEDGCGLLNYEEKHKEEIRRAFKNSLNKMIISPDIQGMIDFSVALGPSVKESKEVFSSLKMSKEWVKERIVSGTGCLIEKGPKNKESELQKHLEHYTRKLLNLMELLSVEESEAMIEELRFSLLEKKGLRGVDLYELVISAGNLFLMQLGHQNRKELFERFSKRCNRCGTVDTLFYELRKLQADMIRDILKERENDSLRPIRQAKQYIKNHFGEQLTLEEVSKEVGLSPSYFSTLFKKEISDGFAKYLINVRMEEAKILLRDTNISVAEICKKVGYNDIKHFTHTFDKVTGLKPSAYRKLYG